MCWLWAATDSIPKLLLAVMFGNRWTKMAQRLVHNMALVPATDIVPLYLTDQLAASGRVFVTRFGQWVERQKAPEGRVLRRR